MQCSKTGHGRGRDASFIPRPRTERYGRLCRIWLDLGCVTAPPCARGSTPMMDRFTGDTASGARARDRAGTSRRDGKAGGNRRRSDGAAFVVGHATVVDGGQTA
jgi:hypothetical protein